MKITGKLFKCDNVNANGEVIPYDVAENAIYEYKTKSNKVFTDAIGHLVISNNDNQYGFPSVSDIIGKITRLEIVDGYAECDAELINTPNGITIQELLKNNAFLRFAVIANYTDNYNINTDDYKSEDVTHRLTITKMIIDSIAIGYMRNESKLNTDEYNVKIIY